MRTTRTVWRRCRNQPHQGGLDTWNRSIGALRLSRFIPQAGNPWRRILIPLRLGGGERATFGLPNSTALPGHCCRKQLIAHMQPCRCIKSGAVTSASGPLLHGLLGRLHFSLGFAGFHRFLGAGASFTSGHGFNRTLTADLSALASFFTKVEARDR